MGRRTILLIVAALVAVVGSGMVFLYVKGADDRAKADPLRAIGVTDIVVVDTPDALLVTTTANAQRVKAVVDALKLSGRGDIL